MNDTAEFLEEYLRKASVKSTECEEERSCHEEIFECFQYEIDEEGQSSCVKQEQYERCRVECNYVEKNITFVEPTFTKLAEDLLQKMIR